MLQRYDARDTIAAVSSPPGESTTGILRLSGPRALAVAERLGGRPGALVHASGFTCVPLTVLGEAVHAHALVFRAPRSYTKEDMVELYVPGSPALVARLLDRLLALEGVRPAGPGEFTLRAFLNGRIDLAQAEAVARLVTSEDAEEVRAARRALQGELRGVGLELREALVGVLARIEAELDFADEDIPPAAAEELLASLEEVRGRLEALQSRSRVRPVRGAELHVVLAGSPNAGKSTLLNAIAGREAALVSPYAGTTRDPVRAVTHAGACSVEWIDLPGLPPEVGPGESRPDGETAWDIDAAAAGSEMELPGTALRILRRMALAELETADAVVWVADATSEVEREILRFTRVPHPRKLFAATKADLLPAGPRDRLSDRVRHLPGLVVSGKRRDNIGRLVEAALRLTASDSAGAVGGPADFVLSAHQYAALRTAADALERAAWALRSGMALECAASDLRDALAALSDLAGEVTADEILGRIFAAFCVGK